MSELQTQHKSILIVDDEKEILIVLQDALKDIAQAIHVADNGQTGLELARLHKPALIISDYHMPELNGLEFLKSLNEDGFNAPVIWTTGWAKGELQRQAWMHGVYDIIEKPFDTESFKQCVVAAMRWQPDFNSQKFPCLVSKLAMREVSFSLDVKSYEELSRICKSRNISITTFMSQLIEAEIKKAA